MTIGDDAGKVSIGEKNGVTSVSASGGPTVEFSGAATKDKDGNLNTGTNSGTGQETPVEGKGKGATIKTEKTKK